MRRKDKRLEKVIKKFIEAEIKSALMETISISDTDEIIINGRGTFLFDPSLPASNLNKTYQIIFDSNVYDPTYITEHLLSKIKRLDGQFTDIYVSEAQAVLTKERTVIKLNIALNNALTATITTTDKQKICKAVLSNAEIDSMLKELGQNLKSRLEFADIFNRLHLGFNGYIIGFSIIAHNSFAKFLEKIGEDVGKESDRLKALPQEFTRDLLSFAQTTFGSYNKEKNDLLIKLADTIRFQHPLSIIGSDESKQDIYLKIEPIIQYILENELDAGTNISQLLEPVSIPLLELEYSNCQLYLSFLESSAPKKNLKNETNTKPMTKQMLKERIQLVNEQKQRIDAELFAAGQVVVRQNELTRSQELSSRSSSPDKAIYEADVFEEEMSETIETNNLKVIPSSVTPGRTVKLDLDSIKGTDHSKAHAPSLSHGSEMSFSERRRLEESGRILSPKRTSSGTLLSPRAKPVDTANILSRKSKSEDTIATILPKADGTSTPPPRKLLRQKRKADLIQQQRDKKEPNGQRDPF